LAFLIGQIRIQIENGVSRKESLTVKLIDAERLVTVASGFQTIGPLNIPDNLKALEIRFARCTAVKPLLWASELTFIEVNTFVSYNGVDGPWEPAGGFSAHGGVLKDRNGNDEPYSGFGVTLQRPASVGRKLKFDMYISNGPFVSDVTVDMA
jgi:hypothetical protein